MAHLTYVPYAPYPSHAPASRHRRRAGADRCRISLLKAVLAFVAALVGTALASADDPGFSGMPQAPWLLQRMAAPGDDARHSAAAPAPAAAPAHAPAPPQERLPLSPSLRSAGSHAVASTADGPIAPGDASEAIPDGASGATAWMARLLHGLETPLVPILAGVAAVALVLRAVVMRAGGIAGRPEGVVDVLARYPLGRRQQIVLMRVGRRVIVAHQADRTMRTLSETGDPDEVAELIEKARAPGRDLFARLLERRRRDVDPFAEAELVDLTRGRAVTLPEPEPRA